MEKKRKLNLIEKLNILAVSFPMLMLIFVNNNVINILSLSLQLIVILINLKRYKKALNKTEKNLIALIITFFTLTLIINAFGKYTIETTKTTIIIFSSIFLSLLLIISDYNRITTIKGVSNIIVTLTIGLIVYAIIIRTFGSSIVPYQTKDGTMEYRQYLNVLGINFYQNVSGDKSIGIAVASLTSNPNMFAPIIVFSIIIVLTNIEEKRKKNLKYGIDLLKIVFMLYGIYIVNSRISILILLIVLPMYFIIKPSDRKEYNEVKILSLFMIIFIIGVGIILLFPNLLVSIDLNGREEMWQTAKETIDRNLLSASGLGASGKIIKEMTGFSTSMHNAYLSFIIDYGILIFLFFAIFNLSLILRAIKYIISHKSENNMLFVRIFLIYMCLLINGITEGTFMTYSMFNYVFFYCIFYMYLIPTSLKGENSDNNIYTNIQQKKISQ